MEHRFGRHDNAFFSGAGMYGATNPKNNEIEILLQKCDNLSRYR